MNHYHILTPLSRLQNLESLIDNLESQRRPQFELTWHPLFDEGLPYAIHFRHRWIVKGYCPRAKPFWRVWAASLNRFTAYGIEPDHFFSILNDDDLLEPGFFAHLDKVRPNEIMIVSMKRGDSIPPGVEAERAHGTTTLEAKPESMQVGHVGAEQLICRGEIWKAYPFNDTITADGERIVQIVAAEKDKVTYVPDCYVYFNALERGRWNSLP